jgi:hypothetical protein
MGDLMSPMDPTMNPVLLLSRLQRWRMAFFGLVILLAGVAIGAGISMIWMGQKAQASGGGGPLRSWLAESRPDPGGRLLPMLRQYLTLDGQQMQTLGPILKEHLVNIEKLRQDVRPRVAEELRQMDREIVAVLRPDQRRIWDRRFGRLQEQLQWLTPFRGRPGMLEPGVGPNRRPGRQPLPEPPDKSAPSSAAPGEQGR